MDNIGVCAPQRVYSPAAVLLWGHSQFTSDWPSGPAQKKGGEGFLDGTSVLITLPDLLSSGYFPGRPKLRGHSPIETPMETASCGKHEKKSFFTT